MFSNAWITTKKKKIIIKVGLGLFYVPRAGLWGNIHVIVQTLAVLGFSLFLYFRHPSVIDEKIAALVKTTGDRAMTVKSGSTVFSFPQKQRAVSTAEEFCVQIHAIKLAVKPQQNIITMNVSGGNSKDSPSPH